jgi:hypothetical protein
MTGDALSQLLLRIQASELYALQLDESTDMAGLAQLLVYVRYVYGVSIKEDILLSTGQLSDIKWTSMVKMCWYLY